MNLDRYRNILLIIVIILFGFIMFIVYTFDEHIKNSKEFITDTIKKEAISYFDNIIMTRKWNALHGGVYVKKTKDLEPNKYLKNNQLFTDNGEMLIKINPAWMTRQISEISNKENQHYFKITSLNPINPINTPDSFEREALEYFDQYRDVKYYTKVTTDLSKFNFMGSLKVTKACMNCHAEQGYKIGDIRGGIRVSIPTKEYYHKLSTVKDKGNLLIGLVLLISLIILIVLVIFFNRLARNNYEIQNNLEKIKKLKSSNDKLLQRYEYAIDGSQEGLWDWNLLTNEVVFTKNWKGMLGYKDDEIKDSFSEWDNRVHPDDKEQAKKDILANQNKETKYYQNIHRLKHKNGTWVWILDRGQTYFDDNGKAIRMLGSHTDITELKNLELELEATKKELLDFRIVIESAPLSIIITDIEGNITYVNPFFCESSGYKENEIIGKNPRVLKPYNETDNKKFIDLWRSISNKKTWGGIFRNVRKDGSEYWETATILPILNNNGEIMNYLGIMREITKEIYLEKELKEKEEMMLSQSRNAAMGEMISMIAHQWRQPITAISMSANNIIADIELEMVDEEEIKTRAENISEQTQYLSKTIDDFRNFFKKDKMANEFPIRELIDEISSIMLASLENSGIEFILNDLDKDMKLKTYKRELLQVLLNIIKNAKEALVENNISKKYIKVEIKKEDEKVQIIISDNAGGIKDENIDKIFNAYFTTKEQYNGTGLGLYMSRMIIEKHLNGSLTVSNDDKGAVFKIVF